MYLALRDGPRGFTQDLSCPGLLGIQLPNKTHFNYGTFTPYGRPFQTASSISSIQISLSHYPSQTAGLGSSPFVRHYLGNHCYFLFLALLRCFSSRRSPPLTGYWIFNPVGCPIRISPGRSSLTARRGFSQFATSFFAIWCVGIHRVPFVLSPYFSHILCVCDTSLSHTCGNTLYLLKDQFTI